MTAATTHYVYRLLGANGEPLYTGVTKTLQARLGGHSRKPYWPEVSRIEIDAYPDQGTAQIAERAAITAAQPLFNETYIEGRDTGTTWATRLANRRRAHASGQRCRDRQCPSCRRATA